MHESQKEVVKNLARHAIEHEHHKLVFRSSGNVFCDFVYLFVNDDLDLELLYFMLNRNVIFDYYHELLERISVDEKSIAFRTDDRVYRFDDYGWIAEEHGDDAGEISLDEEFWNHIYAGYFDPLPLTEKSDAWGILKVHSDVPRI